MLSADPIVLGSPDYMDAPAGSTMNFIHRMYPLYGKTKGRALATQEIKTCIEKKRFEGIRRRPVSRFKAMQCSIT